MKIKTLKLKNFRGYREEICVDFANLTAFVGKNDIGKSTILEALDIFFNNGSGVTKFELLDINVDAPIDDKVVRMSVEFTDIPTEVVLDETVRTDLMREYLLNQNNNLEIVKEFRSATATGVKVFIRANHPTNIGCNNLLSKKQIDLQHQMNKLGVQCDDMRVNSLMRYAIWNHYSEDLQQQIVDLDVSSKDGDIKAIWGNIQEYLPIYSLFQSDRKNNDSDGEVQEPLKETVKVILAQKEIRDKLEEVAEVVTDALQNVADTTLQKIREMNPDLANSLHPQIPNSTSLKWLDVFKSISMAGDNDIPINKRGSGVKRLILLNFFRAEAERRCDESNSNTIIYAIEEPETSQHVEHQNMLIMSLQKIANMPNAQVIITTHSGNVVKHLEESQLRLISKGEDGNREIRMFAPRYLPYTSLNEANYLAFGQVSEEYHDELYGYLQNKAIGENSVNSTEAAFDAWLAGKGLLQTKVWIRIKRDGSTESNLRTLQTYIRNMIHHPENQRNHPYSEEELRKSIEDMLSIV